MNDAEHHIIRLLTEIRDEHREELAYRRRVIDESVGLQRKAIRMQRTAVFTVFGMILLGVAVVILFARLQP